MNTNLRGRDPILREAQAAAQAGLVRTALDHLKHNTVEAKGDGAIVAAERRLSLPAEERERTAIYASGRKIRAAVNEAVQTGLAANREIGPEKLELEVLDRANLTREELRYLAAYRLRYMVLEVAKLERALGLKRGDYLVRKVDDWKGIVELEDKHGRLRKLKASRIGHAGKGRQSCAIRTGAILRSTKAIASAGLGTTTGAGCSTPTGPGSLASKAIRSPLRRPRASKRSSGKTIRCSNASIWPMYSMPGYGAKGPTWIDERQ